MRREAALLAVLFVADLLATSPVGAQTTGISMEIDPSVISAGMGGASTAVPWGGDPNVWANPALLGYTRGVRWQWGKTQLVPGLSNEIFFTHTRLLAGGAGIGVENAGDPLDAGGIELSYDDDFLEGHETVNSTGFGVSASRLIAAIATWRDTDPPVWSEVTDVAFGWRQKEVTLSGFLDATAKTKDLGVLFRAGTSGMAEPPSMNFDFTYAYAVLNSNDALFQIFPGFGVPASRQHRHGLAARVTLRSDRWESEDGWTGVVLRGLDPWWSVALAYDRVHVTAAMDGYSAGGQSDGYHEDLAGLEVTFANVLSLRGGRVGNRLGGFHHGSWGVGLNLPIGDVAGFRFDYAKHPQSSDLDFLDRRAYAVWLDPLAAWSAFQ